jgi:hypothetical protein
MAIFGGVMGYGWYHLFHGQREKIEYGREKAWARIYLTPVMQAEEDRDQARRYFADQAREKELLGGNSEVYNSDRYVVLFSFWCFGGWGAERWRCCGQWTAWVVSLRVCGC